MDYREELIQQLNSELATIRREINELIDTATKREDRATEIAQIIGDLGKKMAEPDKAPRRSSRSVIKLTDKRHGHTVVEWLGVIGPTIGARPFTIETFAKLASEDQGREFRGKDSGLQEVLRSLVGHGKLLVTKRGRPNEYQLPEQWTAWIRIIWREFQPGQEFSTRDLASVAGGGGNIEAARRGLECLAEHKIIERRSPKGGVERDTRYQRHA